MVEERGGVFFMGKFGRPVAEDPKQNRVTIRMNDESYQKLIEYNKAHNQTITETMSEAFDLLLKKKAKEKA